MHMRGPSYYSKNIINLVVNHHKSLDWILGGRVTILCQLIDRLGRDLALLDMFFTVRRMSSNYMYLRYWQLQC